MTKNPIEIRIGNVVSDILGDLSPIHWKEIEKRMSFRPQNYIFTPSYNKIIHTKDGRRFRMWDGWKRLIHKNTKRTYFPTGLYSIASSFFKEELIPYKVVDTRVKPCPNLNLSLSEYLIPRDYQNKVGLDSVIKERGIIQAATGSGKTAISAIVIASLKVSPFLFFVTSIDLLTQAKSELEKFLRIDGKPFEVGQIGGGSVEIRDINVITVQTAVRALGKKWDNKTKFDDDDTDDPTPIESRSEEIKSLIRHAKGGVCDETQHWRCDTCQIIAKELVECYYIYGTSATPYRDESDDLMIQSCFGKKIAEITASELIQKNWLIKPSIKMVHIRQPKTKFRQWHSIYKECVTNNDYYNNVISNIANAYIEQDRLVLILVQQINHGKLLESMIPGSMFLSGKSPKQKRINTLNKLRNKEISCIISSSLPYNELLLIKQNGVIKQIEIGDLCHNFAPQVKNNEIDVCCSFDGKNASWSKVTDIHIHRRSNNIVRVETNRGEDIYVTENHSLIKSDLSPVLPQISGGACVPINVPPLDYPVNIINVAELLKDINDPSIEVEVLGITQPMIRKIKSEYTYVYGGNHKISKSTRWLVKNRIHNKNQEYFTAIYQLINNFKYYKYKYRARLSDVWWCKELFNEFKCRIYIRRSRKEFSLPVLIPITDDLATLSGLMCGDGHIKNHTRGKSCKSIYSFEFAGLKDMSTSPEGHNDPNKLAVRDIFKRCFHGVFGDTKLRETDTLILFRSKLMYYLFWKLGHIDTYGQKRVPDYVYNSAPSIQEKFLWGMYLSDGSLKIDYNSKSRKTSAFIIHNTSRPLVTGIQYVLRMLRLPFYVNTSYCYNPKRKRVYNISIVRSTCDVKIDRTGRDKLNYNDSNRYQKTVEFINSTPEFVYDISVDKCHNFIAGCGVLAHNSIFDEGIDVKPLDTLLLAGQGKSRVRAMQRIGRILRPFKDTNGREKTTATAIDFCIHQKYLEDHAKAREKMYSTEPEFVVENIDNKAIHL
jgi:superfamily II DNA or RNA helicase